MHKRLLCEDGGGSIDLKMEKYMSHCEKKHAMSPDSPLNGVGSFAMFGFRFPPWSWIGSGQHPGIGRVRWFRGQGKLGVLPRTERLCLLAVALGGWSSCDGCMGFPWKGSVRQSCCGKKPRYSMGSWRSHPAGMWGKSGSWLFLAVPGVHLAWDAECCLAGAFLP